MSQASTERLRNYLAQLPPQSLALLMREFERAVERGEDTKTANLVLEQLRKIVRQAEEEDDESHPRSDDPARLLFRPLEPFLAESNFPVRPGQIRRASLLSVWQWLIRDGAVEAAREFEAALSSARESASLGRRLDSPNMPTTANQHSSQIAAATTDVEQRAWLLFAENPQWWTRKQVTEKGPLDDLLRDPEDAPL